MSEESDTKPSDEPVDPTADESAAAAKEAAKDFANNAGAAFQGLNQRLQIYLVALAITLVCSFLFGAFKTKVKMGEEFKEIVKLSGHNMESRQTSPSLVGLKSYSGAAGGKLAFLGAAAGIGILLWSTANRRKDPWIPLGLAAAAGIAVLGILMTRSGLSSGSSFGGISSKTGGTLLGWWLPLAAAGAATFVSVQRIRKA